MMKKVIAFIVLCVMWQSPIYAQAQWKDKVYADARVGVLFPVLFGTQLGAGYRLDQNHGIGISYHRETYASIGGNLLGMKGLGLDYRYSADLGFIVKMGVGKVLTGWKAVDFFDEYRYREAKLFTDLSIAYQIRPGFTFGVYGVFSSRMRFDQYYPAWYIDSSTDSEELILSGEATDRIINFGVTIGYAIPWKKKEAAVRAFSRLKSKTSMATQKVYADIKWGGYPDNEPSRGHFQFGLGHRLNETQGIGLSYHVEKARLMTVVSLGIDYRYSTEDGLIVKAGIGKIVYGRHHTDYQTQVATGYYIDYKYKKSKGILMDISAEYQIRPGFTFGVYLAFSPRVTLNRYLPAYYINDIINSDKSTFHSSLTDEFINFGWSIGYAIPWKKKQKK